MFELSKFIHDLIDGIHLGEVDIKFTGARTKGNKLLLVTEIDFPGALFWLMQGELTLDLTDGSVDLIDEDSNEPSLIVTVMDATKIEELPSMQVCKSEFVRWLADLKIEELEKND